MICSFVSPFSNIIFICRCFASEEVTKLTSFHLQDFLRSLRPTGRSFRPFNCYYNVPRNHPQVYFCKITEVVIIIFTFLCILTHLCAFLHIYAHPYEHFRLFFLQSYKDRLYRFGVNRLKSRYLFSAETCISVKIRPKITESRAKRNPQMELLPNAGLFHFRGREPVPLAQRWCEKQITQNINGFICKLIIVRDRFDGHFSSLSQIRLSVAIND